MFDNLITQLFGKDYFEVAQDTPIVKTVASAAAPLMGNIPYKWVLSYLIKVRSMGTATYIGVGDQFGQGFRLTYVGETFGFSANLHETFDLSKVWISSDTSDAVIEIVIVFIPIPMQGSVYLAPSRNLVE
jgi:hypothetical protein